MQKMKGAKQLCRSARPEFAKELSVNIQLRKTNFLRPKAVYV
jgi:hypothetical protein